jgi:hypothetical protein
MQGRRRSQAILFAVLVLSGTACADMMPAWWPDAGSVATGTIGSQADLQPVDTANLVASLSFTELDSRSVTFLPEAGVDVIQARITQSPAQVFANDRSSLELCLYALLGFGLCRSAPCLKKVHIGFVPDWFHSGGPQQIGHSHVLDWNSLSSPPVCLVQPECPVGMCSSQYGQGDNVSLWRESQFTPCVSAPRGPPLCSC